MVYLRTVSLHRQSHHFTVVVKMTYAFAPLSGGMCIISVIAERIFHPYQHSSCMRIGPRYEKSCAHKVSSDGQVIPRVKMKSVILAFISLNPIDLDSLLKMQNVLFIVLRTESLAKSED